ncbi:MAG: energy-coupling factor transporter transmembrane component T family protein [Pseudomonadota bacterium]
MIASGRIAAGVALHPRGRLAAAVLASVGIAVTSHRLALALLLLAALGACACAIVQGALAAGTALGRVAAVNGFVALTALTLPFAWTAAGPVLDPSGVELAWLVVLRANAVVLACTALLAGVDAATLARAAAGLRAPDKLCRLLFLIARYLDLLGAERARIERAMRARGFVPRSDRRTVEAYGKLVAALLAGAVARAERVERAMRARGFGRAVPAAPVREAKAREWAWAGGTACVLAAAWAYAGVG